MQVLIQRQMLTTLRVLKVVPVRPCSPTYSRMRVPSWRITSFEDTGVRAYKGGAALLISNNTVLEAALNIHSVEARHASHMRTIRRGGPQAEPGSPNSQPQSWPSGNDNGGPAPAATAAVYGAGNPASLYPSEANVIQGGLNVQNISQVSPSEASEAFDEPLDMGTVLAIAGNFIK